MDVIRYPRPLRRGDRIGVTGPSAGVDPGMEKRLDFAVSWLEDRGFEVEMGQCLDGSGVVSASPRARADELMQMLLAPEIRAIVPPWGGKLAVEILPLIDFDAIAQADPTWVVGYSDISTLLVPITTLTGTATLHGQNLMDTPNELPAEVAHWTAALSMTSREGSERPSLHQSATRSHASLEAGYPNYREYPSDVSYTLDQPGRWRPLRNSGGPVEATGRLIGGCIEVLAPIAGSSFGDIQRFTDRYADDGVIVYVEASDSHALDIARGLWSLRLAGWFDNANAVLVGRTHAPAAGAFAQEDAVRSALGDLTVPVILDVDCGHVVPQLALVNGATAHVVLDGDHQSITQTLD